MFGFWSFRRKKEKEKRKNKWSAPPIGSLKFNTDSAARCKPDPAGIGGVLQNHERQVLLTFPKSIGVRNLHEADVFDYPRSFEVVCVFFS